MRLIGILILLGCMLPVASMDAEGAPLPASRSPASEVALSVSLPGRPGFQRNALAEVAITLKNVSGHAIQLATATCRLPYLFAEVVSPSGTILYPPAAVSEPESPCVPPPASPPIQPGKSVSMGGFLVLRAATVRPVAQIFSGNAPAVVRGKPLMVRMYSSPAVRATIHRSPVPYAQLTPASNGFSEATYRYWYTCQTASGSLLTEEHPQSILHWDYGQGPDIYPRFDAACTRVLDWHAIGGFLFSRVTQVNETVPFTLSQAPVTTTPTNATTARAQYNAAFAALNAVPHFIAHQTQTRLAYPERGVPSGLVTESRTMEYVGPDRLANMSRALNPVGKMVTQRYVQVGPVICSLDPFNFPAHTWQPYPYDAFSYRDHRPDIGLTAMQNLGLSYRYPKGSALSDGPPQPVTTVHFSRTRGAVSSQGQTVSIWIIQIHIRSLYANTFLRIKYKGRLYTPSRSDETAKLFINAASSLPMQFQSTTRYTIGKAIQVLDDQRQISFDYDGAPHVGVPSSTCE
ncbi:MAG: hypothetical protein M3Z66_22070 [Chloroflexota bacterium]|nr:hypothetical protein [Chloroflexota bacterium]